ncbi:MAG TPA: sigma-70 family RNA polymerase sigma factor [Gaiellaceae bacterium]|nr:sigma-70 family RNA polymerase sigma factor [Gaiellaceae bacterium]
MFVSALEALDSRNAAPTTSPEAVLQGLFERHSDRILGFCLRRLGSRQEAEDAHQNTFLHAFRALQRGVRPVSETAWLFKIAENACLAAHRTNGRRRRREAHHDPELLGALPADGDGRETAAALRSALATLPASQRNALLLREWRGLSYREIAAELGLTVAAVETLIFRARRGVARALERDSGIRARLGGVLDLGSVFGALKGMFSGAAAVKVAAAATVIALATLPAGDMPAPKVAAAPEPVAEAGKRASVADTQTANAAGGDVRSDRAARPAAGPSPAKGKRSWPRSDRASETTGGPSPGARTDPPQSPEHPAEAPPAKTEVIVAPPTLPKVDVPGTPELSEPPELPQLPQAPQVPQVPEVPQLPQLPQAPDLPLEAPPILP